MLNLKFPLFVFTLIGVSAGALEVSCTTDGLCKTNADCCEHYICASWSPEGYHCMTGCQPPGGFCKEDIDCCATDAICRNVNGMNVCGTKHPHDEVVPKLSGALEVSCTTDGLCKSDADCCDHYICAAWSPEGYHCMTGCQPHLWACKDDLDCCATNDECRDNYCKTKIPHDEVVPKLSGALEVSCTTDGLCKSNADCCEHYICASWSPEGYHCMTGCQPYGGICKDDIDCCSTDNECRDNYCKTKHPHDEKHSLRGNSD